MTHEIPHRQTHKLTAALPYYSDHKRFSLRPRVYSFRSRTSSPSFWSHWFLVGSSVITFRSLLLLVVASSSTSPLWYFGWAQNLCAAFSKSVGGLRLARTKFDKCRFIFLFAWCLHKNGRTGWPARLVVYSLVCENFVFCGNRLFINSRRTKSCFVSWVSFPMSRVQLWKQKGHQIKYTRTHTMHRCERCAQRMRATKKKKKSPTKNNQVNCVVYADDEKVDKKKINSMPLWPFWLGNLFSHAMNIESTHTHT